MLRDKTRQEGKTRTEGGTFIVLYSFYTMTTEMHFCLIYEVQVVQGLQGVNLQIVELFSV